MKNILILGGAGFIGSNLAEFFVNTGKNVIIFGREKSNWSSLSSILNKIKIIKGDFDDSKIIKKIFDENQINIVIHLVTSVIPSTPVNDIIKNKELISTMHLINVMIEKKVDKIIFVSSGGSIYGMNGIEKNKEDSPTIPINFNGWLKLTIENYIQMCNHIYGLNYIILRASNLYGKNQNILGDQGLIAVSLGKLLHKKQIDVWGDGKIVRDYLYIDDFCKALLMLINNNKWNDIYNIGSEKGISVNNVLQIIKNISSINFDINYKKGRIIDVPVNILNVSKLKNNINWDNLIGLEKGIKIMWKGLKDKI